MKRFVSFLLLFVFIFTAYSGTALASEPEFTGDINAYAWMLVDADSGEVLASSQNEGEQIEPASTTKIMTLLVALEYGNLNDTVTISSDAAGVRGSSCDLDAGDEINLENLLTAMMMQSGNDAATAVAEHIGDSVDGFVSMMNAKALELGMTNTHFVTPHGLHDEDHYTTLSDMAKLASAAMQNSTFMEIIDRASYTLPENGRTYENTNALLDQTDDYYYPYANGMKTGSTDYAGPCLVASATKDGMNLIAMFFDADESADRWTGAKKLFDFGFTSYKTVALSELLADTSPIQETVENCSITDENGGLLEFASPGDDVYVTLPIDTAEALLDGTDTVEVDTTFVEGTPIQAPIAKDDVLGTVTYKSTETGGTLYTCPLIATRDVLLAGTESNVNGGTAVATLPPTIPEQIAKKSDQSGVWLWLLIPVALIAFLVFRLLTVNRKRRKRYSTRKKPQYSYKIRR